MITFTREYTTRSEIVRQPFARVSVDESAVFFTVPTRHHGFRRPTTAAALRAAPAVIASVAASRRHVRQTVRPRPVPADQTHRTAAQTHL